MTRLSDRLASLRERGERALVCYVMAGDPSPEGTLTVVRALDAAGVDAIELGVPFSDPLADGPSIQAAGQRALAAGMTVPRVLDLVRAIRRESQVPIVLMTYYNPTLHYGVERFARDAAAAGADATIQTDLTPEEAEEWLAASRRYGLDTVFLVAPTSTAERIEQAARITSGFVYCVSRTGVTGARAEVPADLPALVDGVRRATSRPVCVGFGVSTPEHVRAICRFADGVVVGSALVDIIAHGGAGRDLADAVGSYAQALKAATRPG